MVRNRGRVFSLEHRRQRLLPRAAFLRRVGLYVGSAATLVAASLGVGMAGYHALEGLPWVDAFLNASMILGGMGPVAELRTTAGKLFAGCYALYAGLIFIVTAGMLCAPLVHRLLHRFHMDEAEDAGDAGNRPDGTGPAGGRDRPSVGQDQCSVDR